MFPIKSYRVGFTTKIKRQWRDQSIPGLWQNGGFVSPFKRENAPKNNQNSRGYPKPTRFWTRDDLHFLPHSTPDCDFQVLGMTTLSVSFLIPKGSANNTSLLCFQLLHQKQIDYVIDNYSEEYSSVWFPLSSFTL